MHTPLGCISVLDVHQPEVGLIIGLILSDGNGRTYYSHGRIVHAREEFFNNDEELLRMFEGACRRLGLSVYRWQDECEHREAQTSSALLYLLLKRFDEFIVKAPADVQWEFIRGLWLGDGHVGSKVVLVNTNLRIIDTVATLLKVYRVKHTVQGPYPPHPPGKKPIYVVYVWKRSRERFLELTGLAEGPPRLFTRSQQLGMLKLGPLSLY